MYNPTSIVQIIPPFFGKRYLLEPIHRKEFYPGFMSVK